MSCSSGKRIAGCFKLQCIPIVTVIVVLLIAMPALAADQDEKKQWLQAHNRLRALHGVPPLSWSEKVAASAQAYADRCSAGHSATGYGENLAWASHDLGASGVVQWWYDEEAGYDYNRHRSDSVTGHFTQVVWKGTKEIGCGNAKGCTNGWAYVWVCQYNPPGNYIGRFAENVFPPISP